MNRIPNPASLPNNNSEHEQRIAAIREKAQRHAQRSARLFAPPPEPESSDLPVPTLLAVACSVALANQAQAQATSVSNGSGLMGALGNGEVNIELTQDISLPGERAFTGNGLNIDGKGYAVELNNNRALWSGATKNITNISNITFKNGGNSTGTGGAVDLYGSNSSITGSISNSHFYNNKSNNAGGGIYTSSDINLIKESEFIGNISSNSHGGALYVVGDMKGGIEGSHFEGNHAYLNGGVIDITTFTGSIRNSTFINNHSQIGSGGAVWVHSSSGVLNGISGSTFEDNSAGGAIGGGAVSVVGTIENGIQDSIFKNNKSLSTNVYSGGGALHSSVINGGISGSSFEGNTAATGGAIFLSTGIKGILNGGIDNSKFIGNTATHSGGGAIHLHNGTLQGGIKNSSEFKNNTTTKSHGGAIWTIDFEGGISNSSFTGNKTLAGSGGAIRAEGSISGGITTGTLFKENSAYTSAGALYAHAFNGDIDGSTFEKNSALNSGGGAIHIHTTFSGDIKNGSKFINNTAKSHGGALWGTQFNGSIVDAEFSGNTAEDGAGGAIWVKNSITGDIQGSTFKNNKAGGSGVDKGDASPGGGNGGAIRVNNIDGTIDNSTFANNTANSGGGAIHLHGGTLDGGIKNDTKFIDNTAGGSGGAIWANTINNGISNSEFIGNKSLTGAGGAIRVEHKITGGISNSIFRENSTDPSTGYGGGAISAGSNWVPSGIEGGIIGSTFEGNTSINSFGGAIHSYVYEGGIHDSKFINNTAGTRGGALDSATWINGGITSGSLFSGNTAEEQGGAIYARNGISGGIADSTFENNTSVKEIGGAISAGGFSGSIINSIFTGNSAEKSGGAIYAPTITSNIIDSEFTGNISRNGYGGGISVNSITGNISGGTFADNTAHLSGGAIFTIVNINGDIAGAKFENNTASTGHGGAIWAGTITGDISSTFTDNKSGIHGGALYLADDTGNNTITNSVFTGNTAGDMGGAIFKNGGTLTVSDSRFLGNIAQYSGGAIKSSNLYIKNSSFIGNQGIDNSGINNSATGLGTGLGGAVLIQGQLDIEDSVFLGNSAAYRGAAIHHHHDKDGNTQYIRIAGGADKTLFYGNQETDTGRYSSIEFSHTRDNLSDVTIHADKGMEGNSGVLMLDAMQSVNNPAISYTAGNVLNIKKTGDGDWFLGGDNQMKHPGNWVIHQGRLALTDVDYDGSGANQAQIDLRDGGFTLNSGATLEGRGTISANKINLSGTINPNIWRNTGTLAKDITTGITQTDIDRIQTVADKADSFATITLDTQGSGNAVRMDGATYEVGVAWKNNGSGGFNAQSDLLDVKGALEVVNNSGINITRLDFDEDWALARIQGGSTDPAATVIQTTQGITGNFNVQVAGAVAPNSDFLKVRGEQTGNNYEIKLGLSWYSSERDSSKTAVSGNSVMDAHGGFTVDTGNSFTIGGALGKRTDVPNFINETTESGGAAGWDGNSLTKRGDGTLILNADNTYDGLTTIEAGKLVLGDSAAKASARVGGDVQINNGAIFDGYGRAKGNVTVDNGGKFTGFGGADGLLHVKNGGLLAPGSATDMATVEAGRLQIDAGGTYQVKTDASGATDLVNVINDATLHGGTVDIRAKDGNWGKRGTQHTTRTIIQTGGTLTGTFDDVTTDLAFLTPTLDYNSNQVNLGLTRNSTKMEDVADGSTFNRINTADALSYLEARGANPTLMNELLGLNKDDALRAFNSLSGEIYPTTGAVLLQSSRQLRTRINTRLTSNTQGTHEAPSFNAIRALGTGDTGTSTPVWVSAWGHNGNQGRSSNAARADISGSGVLVGMDNTDRPVAGGLHAGVMFGSESTKVQIADDRNSRSEVESRSAGLYGGSNIGDTQWRGGLIYSDLDVETQRTVTVNNLTERVSAERKGKQMQAFAEISHNLTLSNRTSVAPWLNVAKVWQSLDATHEGTGATALEIDKQSTSATLTSVGGRGLVNLGDGRTPVSLYADVGYQYVIDGRKVDSKHHFAGQPQDFSVRGTTLNDTLVGAVGVQLGVSRNSALLVEYRGEFGSGQQQHVGNISYQVKF